MLRNDVMILVAIVWVICTVLLITSTIGHLEARANVKNLDKITKEINELPEPVEYMSCVEKVEEVIKPEETVETLGVQYFDVPLDEHLQDHIFLWCKDRGVDPALVIAIIGKESIYNPKAEGDSGNSLGLMQIQPRWHYARMEKYGCTDLLDPYQNVIIGVDILADLFATGHSTEWVLMAYNGGHAYANEKLALGIVSDYATTVIANAATLNKYEVVKEVIQ